MTDYVYIGSSPCEEDCAQVGAANYHALSKLELEQFKKAIIQKMGEPPQGVELRIKEGEVVAAFDPDNEAASEWAWRCEGDAPATWEEVGMKAPRLDDPEFTKTELIAVPNPKKGAWLGGGTVKCDLAETGHKAKECELTNEFIDGATKFGPWANMCPACFGKNGRGLGMGVGQRYKKATDGNFYKVEG